MSFPNAKDLKVSNMSFPNAKDLKISNFPILCVLIITLLLNLIACVIMTFQLNLMSKLQLPLLLANELNPEVLLAAQIVLGLFVLVITLFLALPRYQQVYLLLKLLFEAGRTLVRIIVLLQQLIWDLHQIISMAHDDGFQQVVSVLELIDDVVGSLDRLVDLFRRLMRTCRGIWAIWTARQPAAVANDHQNEVPPTDTEADAANGQNNAIVNEESNI